MSKFGLRCFTNIERPTISQHPSINTIPVDVLEPNTTEQLKASFNVDESDRTSCAASARLWEQVLETYPVPFVRILVADMRYTLLVDKTMSLLVYEELASLLGDLEFTEWVKQLRIDSDTHSQESLIPYKTSRELGFSPSQRWRSTTSHDPFPHCRVLRSSLSSLSDKWNSQSAESLRSKYLNLLCIETNDIEGTIRLDFSAITILVEFGFFQQVVPITDQQITGGDVRNARDALSVLRDTRKTLDIVFELLKAETIQLTIADVCRLHRSLMESSRVLDSNRRYGHEYVYTSIGVTRSICRSNVSAQSNFGGTLVKAQFCPYDEVDAQLAIFCQRFNEILQKPDIDPFAAAAWVSHVFVTIHPFEDGNGRLSRLLASIPLLRNRLPPLSISGSSKMHYIAALNFVRANRDGDYSPLMDILFQATQGSVTGLTLHLAVDA